MSEKALSGQVALVTGGARRIGQSIALALAEAGARVVVHYRTAVTEARETVSEIRGRGGEALALQGDLSRPEDARKLVEEARERFGPADILVNNAGIFEPVKWNEITEKEWDRFFDINLKAQFFCAQSAAGEMKKRGRGKIINLASLGGFEAWPDYIPYCVSKAGVIHLTRCLARALAPEIQVNAVAPGAVQFPGEAPNAAYIQRAPLKKSGTAADIARTVLFLATASDFITGQVFVIDGGHSLA